MLRHANREVCGALHEQHCAESSSALSCSELVLPWAHGRHLVTIALTSLPNAGYMPSSLLLCRACTD